MSNPSAKKPNFIEQAEALILENLSNEQFGVSELAEALHMSRSNLLRKIKKQTQLSASQFIRQVRLKEAMKLLKVDSSTVSEISYHVGFGSTSYFIKCFREQYGYSPGEVGKGTVMVEKEQIRTNSWKQYRWPLLAVMALALILVATVLFNKKDEINEPKIEKSIAVLPFKNESADVSNIYFVNGLMESA